MHQQTVWVMGWFLVGQIGVLGGAAGCHDARTLETSEVAVVPGGSELGSARPRWDSTPTGPHAGEPTGSGDAGQAGTGATARPPAAGVPTGGAQGGDDTHGEGAGRGPGSKERPDDETGEAPAGGSTRSKGRCPPGTVKLHVRDLWSTRADPSLDLFSATPAAITVLDDRWAPHAAGLDADGCGWYETCLPDDLHTAYLRPLDPGSGCAAQGTSGGFDLRAEAGVTDLWVWYQGDDLSRDYSTHPHVPVGGAGGGGFAVVGEVRPEGRPACLPPAQDEGGDQTLLHVRWPWGDAERTGFPGSACEDDRAGIETPPDPGSLRVVRDQCGDGAALLERPDGRCPWFTVLIDNDAWQGNITLRHPDEQAGLFTPAIALPQPRAADEYWLVYEGPPDDEGPGGNCMNRSMRSNVYHFYDEHPGPAYPGCGGTPPPDRGCEPLVPAEHSIVHFRYIWAGQKTFTWFPRPELMPLWIVLEVNGGGGDKDVICWREADSPWFSCPVPDREFHAGAHWRAVDKTHEPEWNTVQARPFPEEAGETWLRWVYGKPDIAQTSRFEFTPYYPDSVGGDWSAGRDWGERFCEPQAQPPARPPITSDGFFPYDETGHTYENGDSIAGWYDDDEGLQELLDTFVADRYDLWKERYIREGPCGPDTARIQTDPPQTVSEGQGYAMVLAAVRGDRALFDRLWRFVRSYLSQDAGKYCGGLMGWMWDGACRPLDVPCDPDREGCGGNGDSAFDGDVDIAIALVYAARQWPEYTDHASGWLLKMECEVNDAYDGTWNYPSAGDTWDKRCDRYPGEPCYYPPGYDGNVSMSYYPPGYFRVFGEFLEQTLPPAQHSLQERRRHRGFWDRTAQTVWEMTERCYDADGVHPALFTDWGHYSTPCDSQVDNYNWSRALFRLAIDAAWYGDDPAVAEARPGSSDHYDGKSRMAAKMDLIQRFYAHEFPAANPVAAGANRFSSICQNLDPSGTVRDCDPALGHNSYFVGTAAAAFVTNFDDGGRTTPGIRREALEEAVSTAVMNDRYYQESLGLYTMLLLSGNLPNPMRLPALAED